MQTIKRTTHEMIINPVTNTDPQEAHQAGTVLISSTPKLRVLWTHTPMKLHKKNLRDTKYNIVEKERPTDHIIIYCKAVNTVALYLHF